MSIKPIFSKIGPFFKSDSKKISSWIKENTQTLSNMINENPNLQWKDIPIDETKDKTEKLIKDGFFQTVVEHQIKGKKDRAVISFEDIIIEISEEYI